MSTKWKSNPAAAVVCCDQCRAEKAQFVNMKQVDDWLLDNPEDFEEYGQFSDGVPHVGDIFLKVGGKLLCAACVSAEIDKRRKGGKSLVAS